MQKTTAALACAIIMSVCSAGAATAPAFALPSETHAIVRGGVSRSPYIGAIAIDAATGAVLFSDGADRPGYPASTTKLMTILLVLEDIESGRYTLKDRAAASRRAASQIPSSIGLKPGQSMTIDDLLFALMVKSANDAAVVLAERSAGTVEAFVARMNARAAKLGMSRTRFASPNGLSPANGDRNAFDVSTAADLAKLAREVVRHPAVFRYTSKAYCTVVNGDGARVTLKSHNFFLSDKSLHVPGLDGLKTGYTDKAGSSIVLTAKRGDRRAIAVVLGSSSRKAREDAAYRIISDVAGAMSMWNRPAAPDNGKGKKR